VGYTLGQATVPASNTVPLFQVPPGWCNVTIYNVNTAATSVYLGSNSKVSPADGIICHSVPTSFFGYMGSSGIMVWGTTGGTIASSVNYLISTGS
jgi:hypothetical protein